MTLDPEELAEGTAHGRVYAGWLRRAQLALGLVSLVAFGGLVGALPLLHLAPGWAAVRVAGVPLPLVLVVVAPFPRFVVIGWLHERRAEGLDAAFRDLVGDDPPPGR